MPVPKPAFIAAAALFSCEISDLYFSQNLSLRVVQIQNNIQNIACYADHADVLRGLRERISKTIDAQSVARKMFEDNALTLQELESIQSKREEHTKAAKKLIDIVQQSDSVFRCFLEALKKTDHKLVSDLIVSQIYKGMQGLRFISAFEIAGLDTAGQ